MPHLFGEGYEDGRGDGYAHLDPRGRVAQSDARTRAIRAPSVTAILDADIVKSDQNLEGKN